MRDRLQLAMMLAPYLVGVAILIVLPAAAGFVLAFADYNALQPPSFAGLANFRDLVADDIFRIAVANSLFYIALAVPLRLAGALLTARLLLRPLRGMTFARAIVYLPTVIPDMAWALIWLWILNPLYGPLNQTLALLGIAGPAWMIEPNSARLAIVLMMSWQIGEGFVVCLASLQAVPRDLLDQAAVDGSSAWGTFRTVTLPSIAPALLILLFRDTIFSFQANFVPALIVGRGGGPDYATTFLPMYIYTTAFGYLRFGYAAAMTCAMFVVTGLVLWLLYRFAVRWGVGFRNAE
ncbi:MAG: sugar ABC transporter permease [Chloroflexia bacterium]|nr:sugar ABC transporter permease [Chloroflexia bacterium]